MVCSMMRSLIALVLSLTLSLGGSLDAFAAGPQRKRKSKKPAAQPCRAGCKPEASAPQLPVATPEDEAAQRELSALARELHNGTPGVYAKLSEFATRNNTSIWGARAALALGYEDYSKNRMAQALGWLLKAQNDTLLREYALYWTAQAQRGLGRNADAYKVLQTLQQDYPNTAQRIFRPSSTSIH